MPINSETHDYRLPRCILLMNSYVSTLSSVYTSFSFAPPSFDNLDSFDFVRVSIALDLHDCP